MNAMRAALWGLAAVMVGLGPGTAGAAGPGSGSGGGKGGSQGGSENAVLFGDLHVIERDGNGIPITKTFTVPGERGDTLVTCVQPIAPNCMLIPLKGELIGTPDFNPEEDDACDAQDAYATLLQEISFGRQSVARASEEVVDAAYWEALNTINLSATSDGLSPLPPFSLDPAGRLVVVTPDEETGVMEQHTIDAPLANLGLYRSLMKDGCLSPITIEREPGVPLPASLSAAAATLLTTYGLGHLVCATEALIPSDMDMYRAASFYAAAADKEGTVSIDEIINVNTYLGINTVTIVPRTKNVPASVTVDYHLFEAPAGTDYVYDRGDSHSSTSTSVRALPYEATVLVATGPASFEAQLIDLFLASPPGVDLEAVNVQVCRGGSPYLDAADLRYCNDSVDAAGGCGGANWFTQTAEDARKIIWFLHNWSVPEIGY